MLEEEFTGIDWDSMADETDKQLAEVSIILTNRKGKEWTINWQERYQLSPGKLSLNRESIKVDLPIPVSPVNRIRYVYYVYNLSADISFMCFH